MKKTLTPNISRYDSKMLLKFNFRTIRIMLISFLAALIGYVLISLFAGFLDALIGACVIFLILAVLQLGEVGGVPLLRIVGLVIADALGKRDIRQYEHTADDPTERLIIERRAGNAERKETNNPQHR